jgi:hypothetical protein
VQSPELYGSYMITIAGGAVSSLDAVTNLVEQNTNSTTAFTGPDVNVKWTNAYTNAGRAISLKDFQVAVLNPTTNNLLRTEYAPAVGASQVQTYSYTFAKNMADNAASPLRSVKILVQCRDANNNLSDANAITLTNPAPATPTGITIAPSFKTNFLSWTRPSDTDYIGVYIWGSKTSGFSPSPATLIASGDISTFAHAGLGDNEQWYYRIAAFDAFSQSTSGVGLNVSSEITTTTLSALVQNEFKLTGVVWTPNSPTANHLSWTACTAIQTLGTGAGATVPINAGSATWTSGVLYIFYHNGWSDLQATTSLAAAVGTDQVIVATYRGGTNLEYGDGKAYTDGSFIIAGTVGASQLVTGSAVITQGAQIASAIITNAQIANGTIVNANIQDATIQGAKIGNAAVNTLQIAGNAVTVPAGASLGGDTNLGTTAEATLMGPVYLDTSGQPIAVMVSLSIYGTGSSPGGSNGNFYVRVNGSIVASWSTYAPASIANTFTMSRMVYVASPGSGSVPVSVTWQANDGSWTARSSTQGGCSMVVLGMKR